MRDSIVPRPSDRCGALEYAPPYGADPFGHRMQVHSNRTSFGVSRARICFQPCRVQRPPRHTDSHLGVAALHVSAMSLSSMSPDDSPKSPQPVEGRGFDTPRRELARPWRSGKPDAISAMAHRFAGKSTQIEQRHNRN
jgi:hypothetical protein